MGRFIETYFVKLEVFASYWDIPWGNVVSDNTFWDVFWQNVRKIKGSAVYLGSIYYVLGMIKGKNSTENTLYHIFKSLP